MEDLQLTMAGDDSDRGRLYLDQASTRMLEARRLMERGRAAQLDHEQLAEVRRALAGVRHDAGEGHRLLHAAYERDGSLGPIQTLNSFTKSHRNTWTQLRDRLPVQLTDVRDEVSSVFDAIDDEVGPLRSLLPQSPESHTATATRRPTGAAPTAAAARPRPAAVPRPAPTAPPSRPRAPRPRRPRSRTACSAAMRAACSVRPARAAPRRTTAATAGGRRPADVTLPPLLPGLLPDLGIDGDSLPK
ncbi:DUF5667 domain-containing protein [Streptomyces albulus]|nr:DUF5667 domain-containing protein [Streptomyces noursei]